MVSRIGQAKQQRPRFALWLKIAIPFILFAAISIFVVGQLSLEQSIEQTKAASQQKLLNVVTLAACALPGDEHHMALGSSDSAKVCFDRQVALLRRFRGKLDQIDDFPEQWYTLLRNHGDTTTFGLMTHEHPFVGDTTIFRDTAARTVFEKVWEDQVPRVTDIYRSDNGRWISALAAVTDSKDQSVAILQVDLHYERYLGIIEGLQAQAHWLQAAGILFAGLLGVALGQIISRPIRRVSRAATKIAESGFEGAVEEPTALKMFPDETSTLIHNFNSMSAELEETVKSLRRANRRLESVDQAKSVYLQFVAHELRTPLNGLGMIKVLPELQELNEDALEFVDDAGKSVDRLREFASAAERYITALTHEHDLSETYELNAALEFAIVELGPYAQKCGVRIDSRFCEERLYVSIPYNVLQQLLHQILHNAIKFSADNERVEVELYRDGKTAECFIRDWGAGFKPEHAERISEPFFVADILHHSQGSGVNLAMAKVYAEHYNGKLKAHSDGPGQGSVFHICLNLAAEQDVLAARAGSEIGEDQVLAVG